MDEASMCSEDTSSIYGDDRTRKLFQACDVNGDGFIDSQDLLGICRQLNLEESTEEILHDLGANEEGKISYEKFLDRRNALRPEINAIRKKQRANECMASSSSNSLGKHERWEFDSGARDLSPERNTLQRLVEAAGCESNTKNLLQLANKLHLAAVTTVKGEVSDLKARLRSITEERNTLRAKLKDIEEKTLSHIVQQHEEQIIELHSVIAELRKKLECQKVSVIQEEESVFHTMVHSVVETENNTAYENETENENQVPDESNKPVTEPVMQPVCRGRFNLNENPLQILDTSNKLAVESACEVKNLLTDTKMGIVAAEDTDKEIYKVISQPVGEINIEQDHCEMVDNEMKQLHKAKNESTLERFKSQVALLELTVDELKGNCERLYLLLGKYESNAIALYESNELYKNMLLHYEELDYMLRSKKEMDCCLRHERDLRLSIERLKKKVDSMESTVVTLESYQTDKAFRTVITQVESRKYDMEMAVLLQDLTSLREKNAALKCEIHSLKKDKYKAELDPTDDTVGTQEMKSTNSNSFQNHLINHLKSSNKLLEKRLEKTKKKSSEKLRAFETEMNEIMSKHAAQVNGLRKKISILEHILQRCESCKANFSQNETQ